MRNFEIGVILTKIALLIDRACEPAGALHQRSVAGGLPVLKGRFLVGEKIFHLVLVVSAAVMVIFGNKRGFQGVEVAYPEKITDLIILAVCQRAIRFNENMGDILLIGQLTMHLGVTAWISALSITSTFELSE